MQSEHELHSSFLIKPLKFNNMGKIDKGILGGFPGKVGTVVGGRWMGIDYMKSKNRKPTKAASEKQLVVRAKFLVVTRFISALGRLVTVSFRYPSLAMTGRNLAFHDNYNGALTGTYPSFSLNFTKIVACKGRLIPVQDTGVAASGNGMVKLDRQELVPPAGMVYLRHWREMCQTRPHYFFAKRSTDNLSSLLPLISVFIITSSRSISARPDLK
jgi:Family of unknown function (DUF6266)